MNAPSAQRMLPLILAAALVTCKDGTTPPPENQPTRLTVDQQPSPTVQNRAVFPVQPAVRVLDEFSGVVARAGIPITVTISAGGGSLLGTTTLTTDANGSVRFTDLAIAGTVGQKTLTFSSSGLASATSAVTTSAGAPTRIAVNDGDNQAEAEGMQVPKPPSVKATDVDGNGTAGVTVTFAVATGGGSVTGATQTTNAAGIATVGSWTLGSAGPNTLTATMSGLAINISATAVRLPVASVEVTSTSTALLPKATVQLTATTRDSVGRPLVNRAVVWTSSDTTRVKVSSTGLATGGVPGTALVTASSEGKTGTLTMRTDAGPAARIVVNDGNNQSEGEGLPVPKPPSVKVTDVDGNATAGVVVTFAVASGGGSVTGTTQTTNAAGVATVGSWILGVAGTNTLSATAAQAGGATVTFSATAVRLRVASVVITPTIMSLPPNSSVQLTATPRDSVNRPLANRSISWTSSDETRLKVSTTGLATGVAPGNATIRATSEGIVGTMSVNVPTPVVLTQQYNGLTGHIGVTADYNEPRPGFEHGFSYYSSVYPLNPERTAGTQLGWGSWLIPNNRTFTQPLCPVGTYARDNWPERGPTYRDVYQTMEGGMGLWVSTRAPSTNPKFRINGTPDCYNTEVASTAWSFYGNLLPSNKLGLAQLSNRLLTVPDGVTLVASNTQTFLGYAWIALPLIPAYTSPLGVPTGDQSWTLFLHATNFRGPVAFYTPEVWSAVNAVDRTGVGRGHDARPGEGASAALEVGGTPMFTSQDATGVRYRRIPRLTFPADASGRAVLMQDVRYYSKQAIWNGVAAGLASGTAPTQFDAGASHKPVLDWPGAGMSIGGASVTFNSMFNAAVVTTAGGQAFGLQWSGAMERGVLPEYFKETGSTWTPVAASDVPRETWLADQTFVPLARRSFPEVDLSTASPWTPTRWAAGPFTAFLNDGSVVDYVWYRFVDQPAIIRLGLSDAVRLRLQTFVESFHQQGAAAFTFAAGPSTGTLTTIDPALIVTPPAGLTRGYVPIVIRQR